MRMRYLMTIVPMTPSCATARVSECRYFLRMRLNRASPTRALASSTSGVCQPVAPPAIAF